MKYHLGAEGTFTASDGQLDHGVARRNPSHLEAVDPVLEGIRPRQAGHARPWRRRSRCCPLLVHGDAAFAGQGVVAETLEPPRCRGYRRGGTVHVVVNNQVGLHHVTAASSVVDLRDRRGRDGAGADLPRERRRPRGVRARGAPRLRVPPGVQQGRRHRHGLLPPSRSQRGRRPVTDAAADVQAHRRASARCASSTPRRSSGGATSPSRRPSRRCATTSASSRRCSRPPRRTSGRSTPARPRWSARA